MKNGHKIYLRGEAGCTEPGLLPGDVILVVMQKEHPTFKRLKHNGVDLVLQVRGRGGGGAGGVVCRRYVWGGGGGPQQHTVTLMCPKQG
jgi:hypothetical protein